jgi:hypothetical protein
MIDYLKEFIDQAILKDGNYPAPRKSLVDELASELLSLNTRDFEPAVRSRLMVLKAHIRHFVRERHFNQGALKDKLRELRSLLDSYLGEGSRGVARSFPFITDAELKRIIERDYSELKLKLFPDEAWKSVVVMAGSILEAILFDVLTQPNNKANANASLKAPRDKHQQPIDITTGDWKLFNLIEVAVDLKILPPERGDAIDQVLRDYRNFVHPKKEVKARHLCNEAEALLAIGALDAVCNHLE